MVENAPSVPMRSESSELDRAIEEAEAILPGTPGTDGAPDERWQAIIRIGNYVGSHPMQVWRFAAKWGRHPQLDLRQAIATVLLEHLLEHHFELIFQLACEEARKSKRFRQTLQMSGMPLTHTSPDHRAKFDEFLQSFR